MKRRGEMYSFQERRRARDINVTTAYTPQSEGSDKHKLYSAVLALPAWYTTVFTGTWLLHIKPPLVAVSLSPLQFYPDIWW